MVKYQAEQVNRFEYMHGIILTHGFVGGMSFFTAFVLYQGGVELDSPGMFVFEACGCLFFILSALFYFVTIKKGRSKADAWRKSESIKVCSKIWSHLSEQERIDIMKTNPTAYKTVVGQMEYYGWRRQTARELYEFVSCGALELDQLDERRKKKYLEYVTDKRNELLVGELLCDNQKHREIVYSYISLNKKDRN